MTWFSASEHIKTTIQAPYDKVVSYFQDPARFQVAFGDDLEKSEEVDDLLWRWTLQERNEVGLTFQPIHLVQYEKTSNGASWESQEGTMLSKGRLIVTQKGEVSELDYKEEIKLEMPVPKLISKLVKGVVAKEIRSGITDFVNRSKEILEKEAQS